MYGRKRKAFQWRRIYQKLFDNILRICMLGEKHLDFPTLLSYTGQMIFQSFFQNFFERDIEILWSFQSGFRWEYTAQLVIFIRAVTADFDIVEKFLDTASLSSTTTGEDTCEQVLKVMEKFELNPAKLCGVTTDGAPSMTGEINGLTTKFLTAVGIWNVVVSHGFIHQENLFTKVLDFADVMKIVVQCLNYIWARELNYQQFKAFLDELDNEYPDVMYFSAVRWLIRTVTLKRFWTLWQEIKFFMKSQHQNAAFVSNENWLNDLAFLTDITQHLSNLNLRLQGKSQLVNKLFEHICAFEKKLELFQVQLNRTKLTHFMCLATRKLGFRDLDCTKYGASVQKLCDEFANRFADFRQNKIKLKLLAQPFDLAVEDSPVDCQMELIELQADINTKRKYSGNSLVDFYQLCLCENFPNLNPSWKIKWLPFLVAPTALSNSHSKWSSPKPDVDVSWLMNIWPVS